MARDQYTYRVVWSEEDHEHIGLCVELPSLSWLAKTPESALLGIQKLVAETVEIPNATTATTLDKTDCGEELVDAESEEGLFKKLGI
jgi:hypothetical protein